MKSNRAASNYKESWADKLDNALGSALFGSKENYRAVQKHAGDNNPYMYTYQEMKDGAAMEAEILSYFIPVGEIFQGLKWGARGLGLLSKAENRVFWSGGEKAMEEAARFANSIGGKTLEMSKRGQILTGLTNLTSYTVTKPLWVIASKTWARGATGPVNVFLNMAKLNPEGIWLSKELGILQERGINIIEHLVK